MSFGKAITALTSRFGVVSQKACVRLATETGKKMVDECNRLGRTLNKQELENVFAQTLPKKLRPKILDSREEIVLQLEKLGFPRAQAQQLANNPNMAGGCVNNGTNKTTIFVDPRVQKIDTFCSFNAHELEHALELNNRLSGITNRKLFPFKMLTGKALFGKDVRDINYIVNKNKSNLEAAIQQQNGTFTTLTNKALNCDATRESVMAFNGLNETRYTVQLRSILRQFADGRRYGSMNNTTLKFFNQTMKREIPAYTVGGEVQHYALQLGKGQIATQTGTAIVYKDAQKIIKAERRLFLKNKLFGKLKKPSVYQSEKDLLRLAQSKEDKKLIKSLIKGMNIEQKEQLFAALKTNPNALNNIKLFREATMVNGKYIYDDNLKQIMNINPEILKNPDFLKIAKVTTSDGYPIYAYQLEQFSKTKPQNLKKFAEIADTKIMDCGDPIFLYDDLASMIEHPQFDKMKKLVDLEVNGIYPYKNLPYGMRSLSAEQIDKALIEATQAQKNGKVIVDTIGQWIDDAIAATQHIRKVSRSDLLIRQ